MKTIGHEVVCIHRICALLIFINAAILCAFLCSLHRLVESLRSLILLSCLMLVDMRSEGFLVFIRQALKVCPILKEFYYCLFYVCEGKEFFYAHFLSNC